jgi:serine/threonine-protein kinase
MARLNHPGVAAVYDVGVAEVPGDQPIGYAISEWTEGRTLGQIMATGPQPWARTADWGRQICGALAALNEIGIGHGALGPNSVVIHDDRQVKLLDAGLSNAMSGRHSAAQQGYGGAEYPDSGGYGGYTDNGERTMVLHGATPNYLPREAPEDIHAVGALLWEAAVGAAPVVFESTGLDQVPLLETGAPPEYTGLLAEMLDPDPARRPTAAEAERRFGPFAVTERISNTLPGIAPAVAPTQVIGPPPTRVRPAAAAQEPEKRRRRGLMFGLAALVVALGVGVGLVLANLGSSGSPAPTGSTGTPSVGSVTLPSGVTSSASQAATSAAPATSSAPSTAASSATPSQSPSPSPSPSPSSASPSPSASQSSTSPVVGADGSASPPSTSP